MDAKSFYDSGIYIAIVAAAFVLVMLLLVLISRVMGGPKKSNRKKKAVTPKMNQITEEAESLSLNSNNIFQPNIQAKISPVGSSPDTENVNISSVGGDPYNENVNSLGQTKENQLVGDSIPKLDERKISIVNSVEDAPAEENEDEDDEEEQEDEVNDDSLDYFNVESVEEDTSLAEIAADLADVDLVSLGELSKEISQIAKGGISIEGK